MSAVIAIVAGFALLACFFLVFSLVKAAARGDLIIGENPSIRYCLRFGRGLNGVYYEIH